MNSKKTITLGILACTLVAFTSVFIHRQNNKKIEETNAVYEPIDINNYTFTWNLDPVYQESDYFNLNATFKSNNENFVNFTIYSPTAGANRNRIIYTNTSQERLPVRNTTGQLRETYKTLKFITPFTLTEQQYNTLTSLGTLTSPEALQKPTLTLENNQLIISNIDDNATNIQLYKNSELYQTLTNNTFTYNLTEAGTYTARAIDNTETYETSLFSNEIRYYLGKLATPNIYIGANNTILIQAIDVNANEISIYKKNNSLWELITTISTDTRYYTPNEYGTYTTIAKDNTNTYQQSNRSNEITLTQQTIVEPEYEVIDLPGLMLQILSMPFTFISTAFNVTLFPNTAYEINFSNLFKGLLAILTILFLVKLFTKGIDAIGEVKESKSEKLTKKDKDKK